jgi:hypothetical protein
MDPARQPPHESHAAAAEVAKTEDAAIRRFAAADQGLLPAAEDA